MTKIWLRALTVLLLGVVLALPGLAQETSPAGPSTEYRPDASLKTRPEFTNYKETSTFDDAVAFLRLLETRSKHIRVETVIRTAEGREVPLAILADPLPKSPAEARKDPRPVIYVQGNIHAGEVEGKDALLALTREMLVGKEQALLKKAIFLFVPIFNTDGNERISPKNRSYMPNPEKGVGVRFNSQGYDLNRDYIKTESREVRSILKNVLLPWDPLLYVDLHTTDGSYHQETVTYLSPRSPNWDASISGYLWDKVYPELTATLARQDIHLLPYGDFEDDFHPEKGWATFPPGPRVGIDYMGLRNRFAVLVENYAYASYPTRVAHCYAFTLELLRYTVAHAAEMKALARKADETAAGWAALPVAERPQICLKTEQKALPQLLTIQGYEMAQETDSRGRPRPKPILDKPRTYVIPYLADFQCTAGRPLPWAYLMSAGCDTVARQLLRHGIRVERVQLPVSLPAKQWTTNSLKVDPWVSEGHSMLTLEGDWQDVDLAVEKGFFLVRLDQPLARLIACMLEPDYNDSLISWNFFNIFVTREWSRQLPPLPLYRVMDAQPVTVRPVAAQELQTD
jgi:hypothetical protein